MDFDDGELFPSLNTPFIQNLLGRQGVLVFKWIISTRRPECKPLYWFTFSMLHCTWASHWLPSSFLAAILQLTLRSDLLRGKQMKREFPFGDQKVSYLLRVKRKKRRRRGWGGFFLLKMGKRSGGRRNEEMERVKKGWREKKAGEGGGDWGVFFFCDNKT